jgi:hypothetical protein
MSFQAQVFKILIASPSDIIAEREIIAQCIREWNAVNSKERNIVLLPVGWESDSYPSFGKPQKVLNKQMVDPADMLIAIFWTRIGTETEDYISGTVEEIERMKATNKPAMVYFSDVQISPTQIETTQLAKLNEFKAKIEKQALIDSYASHSEFKIKLQRQLDLQVAQLISQTNSISTKTNPIDLAVAIYESDAKTIAGKSAIFKGEYFDPNVINTLPDYAASPSELGSKNEFGFLMYSKSPNKDFYRHQFLNFFQTSLLNPLRISIINIGTMGIRDIHIDFSITAAKDVLYFASINELIRNVSPTEDLTILGKTQDIVIKDILQTSAKWEVSDDFVPIQPQRTMGSKILGFIGAKESTEITINLTIYAEYFSKPRTEQLKLQFDVTPRAISAEEIIKAFNDANKAPK